MMLRSGNRGFAASRAAEKMQLHGLAMLLISEASISRRRNTTVCGSGVSIVATASNAALRCDTMPAGGLRMRSKLALTSAEVSGVPSWKRMLGWRRKV